MICIFIAAKFQIHQIFGNRIALKNTLEIIIILHLEIQGQFIIPSWHGEILNGLIFRIPKVIDFKTYINSTFLNRKHFDNLQIRYYKIR